jgi:hypothetical protein
MFLGCVIGRRGIIIRLPPSGLAEIIFLKPLFKGNPEIDHEH